VFVTQLNIQTLLARTRKSILDVELSIAWRVSFMHDILSPIYVSCTGKGDYSGIPLDGMQNAGKWKRLTMAHTE